MVHRGPASSMTATATSGTMSSAASGGKGTYQRPANGVRSWVELGTGRSSRPGKYASAGVPNEPNSTTEPRWTARAAANATNVMHGAERCTERSVRPSFSSRSPPLRSVAPVPPSSLILVANLNPATGTAIAGLCLVAVAAIVGYGLWIIIT